MKFRIVILSVALFVATALHGQAIAPLTAEFGHHKANAAMLTVNQGLYPQIVTVEAVSFTPSNHGPQFRKLDPGVNVILSDTSFKLGAKQQRQVGAKITCPSDCAVALRATFLSPKKDSSIQVAVHLDSAQYVCDRAKDCRANFLKTAGVTLAGK
ncbi:MAG TPA: hypothetical protein VGD60_20355 [Candidatus Acidoferrales bacterium]